MGNDIFAEIDTTEEQILEATYRALTEYGYADLTIQRIGETFEKSQSLVYHHYENKDEVVLACLEFMLDSFANNLTTESIDDPRESLDEIVDWVFTARTVPEDERFMALLIDLRTLACHNPEYADHFTRSDAVFVSYITRIIEKGNKDGDFDVDSPEAVAHTFFTILIGTMLRQTTQTDEEAIALTRDEITTILDTHLQQD